VFDWLAERPLSWEEYQRVKAAMVEQRRWRTMAEGIFPWADVDACRTGAGKEDTGLPEEPMPESLHEKTRPCCNAALTWIFFRSPRWTWQKLCGRAGWLGLCDQRHIQVDFFLTVMN
jgi:hypothetical protein